MGTINPHNRFLIFDGGDIPFRQNSHKFWVRFCEVVEGEMSEIAEYRGFEGEIPFRILGVW